MNNRTTLPLWLACAVLGVALAGCSRSDADDQTTGTTMSAETAAFLAADQAWRDNRHAELVQPDGWTSLIGLHWIENGAHYLGSDADNGMRLALGPEHLGMLELRKGALRFVPEPSVDVTVDEVPVTQAVTLRADDDPAGPSKLGFDAGRGLATVIKRGDRHALRVRHADAPTRSGFRGIDYWPADRQWQLSGQFVANPPGTTIEIANIIGTTDAVANPGAIEFERDGAKFRIEALDEGGDTLFLVFADRTNGHGSYGAGRFLDTPKPDAQGRVVLDFNRAYNPPCAFTAFATCPLPPAQNRLDLAIAAGEKAYAPETK